MKEALDQLEAEGTIEPVSHSEWVTPIVIVPIRNETKFVCGDYQVTVNQVFAVDQYPLPWLKDIFATLAEGKEFTYPHAYNQLVLDLDSLKYIMVNTTHTGYKRLLFGLHLLPESSRR